MLNQYSPVPRAQLDCWDPSMDVSASTNLCRLRNGVLSIFGHVNCPANFKRADYNYVYFLVFISIEIVI